jgi:hypothetical protein
MSKTMSDQDVSTGGGHADEIEATANYLLGRVQLTAQLMNDLHDLVEGPEPEDWRRALQHVVVARLNDAENCHLCGFPRGSQEHLQHAIIMATATDVHDLNRRMNIWRVNRGLRSEK